jgi:gluconolactonase
MSLSHRLVAGALCAVACTIGHDTVSGQSPHPTQSRIAPVTVGKATDIPGVIKGGTPYERILTGFDGLDDPIGIRDGTVLFSEPGARRINQLHPDGRVTVLVADSNESHGITQDAKNRLITAQAWDGSTRIGIIHPPEAVTTLAGDYEGRPFSRPNDAIVARSGAVYFTDPGLTAQQAAELVKRAGGKPLAARLPARVYFIPAGGKPRIIEDKMIRPNGIQLSRDEKTLYISDSNGVNLIAYDINADGSVRNRRTFGTLVGRSKRDNGLGGVKTFGDGMTIDNEGRLYVATGAGVEVIAADGSHVGVINLACPPNDCQNLAFAGPGKRTLYVAGAGSLYRIQMIAQGYSGRPK